MTSILLLTDFSENSINAINYAQQLFKLASCHFFVLHNKDTSTYITDDLIAGQSNQSLYSSLISESKDQLDTFVKDIQNGNPLHKFTAIINHDTFVAAVNQCVIKYTIDLVVMGTNGASNIKETVFGSNALNVLRAVNCNTLVIPVAYKFSSLDTLLLALDHEDSLNDKTVLELLDFVRQHDLKLKILRLIHTEDTPTTIENEDQKWLLDNLKPSEFDYDSIPDVPLTYVVNTFVYSQSVDMIAFVGQYKNFVERLFGDSDKTKITKALKLPLIIFRN